MRNSDGTLNGDFNDNTSAKTSGSIVFLPTSSVDENLTNYDLIPVVLNRPPIITINIPEGSKPQIKPSPLADASGQFLYRFPDGTVKVHIGATFTLNIGAVQPDIFNVENGIPTIKSPDQDLFFVWKHDEAVIRTSETPSLQSRTIVSGSAIRFERIQPSAAGTYVCEISNDIGGVQSEPITIEVLNPDLDAYFYRNLVTNGNATNGVEGWTANNNEFIQRGLYKKEDVELKKPNRVDLFGYNIDTMHPRPYQIDTGLIKNVKYNEDFLRKGSGGYFTRDVYKFERAGGSYYVQAYQEIDLTEIQDIIRGSIYGIDGVRAVFSCYIGNALSQYTPTKNLVLPDSKTDPENYFLGAPRISLENFLTAGAGQTTDQVYVTLEEYDNESRLASTVINPDGVTTTTTPTSVILRDPWDKRKSKYWGQKYYAQDKYKLGVTSNGDWVDTSLFVADELYPNPNDRPTHGQYLEFNRVVLERLNPKTTKIRIAMNFLASDWRMYEHWDYELLGSDRIFEHIGWEHPFKKNTFGPNKEQEEWIRSIIDWNAKYKDKAPAEKYPLAPPPRVAVTGVNFALLPIERQNRKATDYYTTTALSVNNKPATVTPSALEPNLTFDPFGLLDQDLFVTFKHNSPAEVTLTAADLEKDHRLTIELTSRPKSESGTPIKVASTTASLFPFVKGKLTYVYNEGLLEFDTKVAETENVIKTSKIRSLITKGADFRKQNYTAVVKKAVDTLKTEVGPAWTPFGSLVPTKNKRKRVEWKNNAKYMLNYMVIPGTGTDGVPNSDQNTLAGTNYNSYFLVLDLEGENPVTLYRDSVLAGGRGEAEFAVKDYTIDKTGTLSFNLPRELLTTNVQKGGLGIPFKRDHEIEASPLNALELMKGLEADMIDPATNFIYVSNRGYNIEELWKMYFKTRTNQEWQGTMQGGSGNYADNANDATNISGPFAGEDKRGSIVSLLYSRFKNDINAYLYETGSDVPTIAKLKSDWKIDALGLITIKVRKNIPNPNYRTSLYAVRTAPQTGTNSNGTPVYGSGLNGERYSIQYPVVVDSVIKV